MSTETNATRCRACMGPAVRVSTVSETLRLTTLTVETKCDGCSHTEATISTRDHIASTMGSGVGATLAEAIDEHDRAGPVACWVGDAIRDRESNAALLGSLCSPLGHF